MLNFIKLLECSFVTLWFGFARTDTPYVTEYQGIYFLNQRPWPEINKEMPISELLALLQRWILLMPSAQGFWLLKNWPLIFYIDVQMIHPKGAITYVHTY